MTATAASSGTDSSPLSVIGRYGGKRGRQAAVAAAAIGSIVPVYKSAKSWYDAAKKRTVYTITVPGTDDIYPDLHEWVLGMMPDRKRRALIAHTGSEIMNPNQGEMACAPDDDGSKAEQPNTRSPNVRLHYDGSRTQSITLDGTKVTVTVDREDIPNSDKIPENWRRVLEKISFTATNIVGRDAIIRRIDDLVEAKKAKPGPPALMMPSRWGGSWDRRMDLPPRTLDSVILKNGQLERLVDDLAEFFASEAEYNRVSQPWHRGYLFSGAPGTGKTSIVKALANHFDMRLYYLPLADIDKDADLLNLVSCVQPRSILLLEDVDVFHAATDRNDADGRTTLSALLNSLDGIWTPHGLVTFLTTNDRSVLDDALVRPGRIDVDEEFTNLDADQASRLFKWFYGLFTLGVTSAKFNGRSPAELIGAMSKERDNPQAALKLFLDATRPANTTISSRPKRND